MKTMLDLIKQKWVEWLISLILVIITVILTNHFMVKNETKSSIQQQIEQKADKTYVDKQDENVKEMIEQHAIETEKTSAAQMQLIKSMDNKLNILISRKEQ